MRIWFLFVTCFSVLLASADQKTAFDALLEMLKGGDTGIDFQILRYGYIDSPGWQPEALIFEPRRAMYAALRDKKYDEALRHADRILEMAYVNPHAHMVEAMAYEALGNPERAKFHRDVAMGVVRSILASGDGNSTKTAWVVISISEQHAVFNTLGLRPKSQGLLSDAGHNYDAWDVEDIRTKEARKVYFNIDKFFGRSAGVSSTDGGKAR